MPICFSWTRCSRDQVSRVTDLLCGKGEVSFEEGSVNGDTSWRIGVRVRRNRIVGERPKDENSRQRYPSHHDTDSHPRLVSTHFPMYTSTSDTKEDPEVDGCPSRSESVTVCAGFYGVIRGGWLSNMMRTETDHYQVV